MDPGTALGTVSLGIQVCEGLLGYYRDYKGYEEDCQEAYTQIDSLRKTFDYLDDKLKTLPQKALATRAQECITGCQNSIEQLGAVLKKIEGEPSAGIWQRLGAKSRRLLYPFKKDTLERLKSIVQKMLQPLDLAIQLILLDNSQSIKDTVDTTEALVREINATTLDTNAHTTTLAAGMEDILSAKESDQLTKVLDWLSAPDPSTNHAQAREEHEIGTGEWLFESEEYQDWISGSSPLLWLHGKAGCCKTIMCSTIIEDVSQRISEQDHYSFAYFYFSFSDAQKQSYMNLLLSMVTQLSRRRTVHPLLLDAHAKTKPRRPSFRALESILVALLEGAKDVYLVVDALDECSEKERERVILGFQRVTQILPKIRLLMTSRREADIEDLMGTWCGAQIPINEAGVNRDIDLFVKNALATDRKLMRLSSATKKEIKVTFHEKSDGMFRWAALQLAQIRDLKILRPSYISNALKKMPTTLHGTYDRVVDSIEDLYFQEARTALQWLAFSREPLTVAELAEACSIRLDNPEESYSEDGGYEAVVGLLSVLSSLILVEQSWEISEKFGGSNLGSDAWDSGSEASFSGSYISDMNSGSDPSETGYGSDSWVPSVYSNSSQKSQFKHKYRRSCYIQYVRLAHFSVKEYLISDTVQQSNLRLERWKFHQPEVNQFLSESCCQYILHYAAKPELKIQIDGTTLGTNRWEGSRDEHTDAATADSPLLPYACKQWAKHQYLAESGMDIEVQDNDLHIKLLNDPHLRTLWLRMSIHDCFGSWSVGPEEHRGTNSLYWASYHGLGQTMKVLFGPAFGQNINRKGGLHGNAIQAAAYKGHGEIVRTLIANGANVNCQGGRFGTALQAAALEGHEEIVRMLIDNGAVVDSEGGAFRTALIAAAYSGHSNIVPIIIRATNSIHTLNLRAEHHGSAIEVAARRGYKQIVDGLCLANVDHGTAIMESVQSNHGEVVDSLLKYGSNPNTGFYRAGEGSRSFNSPDFCLEYPDQSTCIANYHYYTSVLELAVDCASDSEQREREGRKSRRGFDKCSSDSMLERLLQAGADPKIDPEYFLMRAARKKAVSTFRRLVAAGVKLEHSFTGLLNVAMSHYSLEIVSDLLSAGVVPTLRNFEETTLHASYSKPGYYRNFKEKLVEKVAEMVVEKLLALGMSVDDKDELLVYAAAAGLEMPVLLLLQAGASIHKNVRQERKGYAGNALIAAAAKGHDNLVTLLITKDAYAYNIDYLGEALPCKQVALLEAICYGLKYCSPFVPNPIVRVSKTVQTLIDAGADIHQGNNAALYSVMASRFSKNSSQLALAQLLLDNGANIKARDKEFNSNPDHVAKSPSMLYSAVIAGNLEIVQLALRHGADINGYGRTRISCRTPGSRPDLDDQSISKDRVNNSFASHETVLQGALRHRDVRGNMVELLLANGADVQSLDDDEVCSLIIAARIGEPDSTDLESKRSKVLVIVDKLLEVRGVAGAVFDEAYNDGPLKRALLRFDQDESEDESEDKSEGEGEDKRLEEIRIVMREQCCKFLSQRGDAND